MRLFFPLMIFNNKKASLYLLIIYAFIMYCYTVMWFLPFFCCCVQLLNHVLFFFIHCVHVVT